MISLSESVLREFLEAAPDAMLGVDDAGIIVVVNAQATRLFGYQRSELIGSPVEILVPAEARLRHSRHRADFLPSAVPRPMGAGIELSGRRKDGTEFTAEISLSPVSTADGTLVAASIRDITDRVARQQEREQNRAAAERLHLQHQLAQSQRLESLGQLAGGIAHDFNNLLAVILNYADFTRTAVAAAQAGDPPDDWSLVLSDIEQIEHAGMRAAGMTRRLLTFAHHEVVRPQVLDLNQSVREVEHLLRRSIGEHVDLQIVLAEHLSHVFADPGQIEQVLVNLAINARDAMPTGGTVTIDTGDFTVDDDYRARRPELEDGEYVRLRVSDNGTGMDEATLARVFEPFFSTKPEGEGSGLGLATVYGIVTHAGGSVNIYSEVGPGTTVSVMLPATTEQIPEIEQRPARSLTSSGETVLVVDDVAAIRELTRRVLSRNGYKVLTAAGGAEAIAIVHDHEGVIDLLLTDVIMPEMLGRETAERIALLRPDVRTLYMSGYANAVLSSRGSLDPGLTLLEKPFTELALLEHVRTALDAAA